MKKPTIVNIVVCSVMLCFVAMIGYSAGYAKVLGSSAEQAGGQPSQVFPYCGDANDDWTVDIDDAVYLLDYIFKNDPAPTPYAVASGDAGGTWGSGPCQVDIDDVVYIIYYMFCGGPPTCPTEYWIVGCGECIPGDVDMSGSLDLDDLALMELCASNPDLCPCCGDVDNDGGIGIFDLVYLAEYFYSGGPAPVPSFLCLY